MSKLKYRVEWESELANYKQDFETIEDARIALAVHHRFNARMIIIKEE